MNNLEKEVLVYKSNIFKALAHPSRILIIEEIAGEAKCVGELVEVIGHDFSTVSRHLSVMKNAGLVKDEKRNNQVFYSLIMPCVLYFINCVDPNNDQLVCSCKE